MPLVNIFRRRIGLCRDATRAPSEGEDARRSSASGINIPLAVVLTLIALALLSFPSCTGTAAWDITPPPEGTWPFDRFGNYHEEHADGRHPDADLYYKAIAQGIDILEVSTRGYSSPDQERAGPELDLPLVR